jgi:hypothetical protein
MEPLGLALPITLHPVKGVQAVVAVAAMVLVVSVHEALFVASAAKKSFWFGVIGVCAASLILLSGNVGNLAVIGGLTGIGVKWAIEAADAKRKHVAKVNSILLILDSYERYVQSARDDWRARERRLEADFPSAPRWARVQPTFRWLLEGPPVDYEALGFLFRPRLKKRYAHVFTKIFNFVELHAYLVKLVKDYNRSANAVRAKLLKARIHAITPENLAEVEEALGSSLLLRVDSVIEDIDELFELYQEDADSAVSEVEKKYSGAAASLRTAAAASWGKEHLTPARA